MAIYLSYLQELSGKSSIFLCISLVTTLLANSFSDSLHSKSGRLLSTHYIFVETIETNNKRGFTKETGIDLLRAASNQRISSNQCRYW